MLVNGVPAAELRSANGRAKKSHGYVPPKRWDMNTTGKTWRSRNIRMRSSLTLGASCCAFGPVFRAKCLLIVVCGVSDHQCLLLWAN